MFDQDDGNHQSHLIKMKWIQLILFEIPKECLIMSDYCVMNPLRIVSGSLQFESFQLNNSFMRPQSISLHFLIASDPAILPSTNLRLIEFFAL